MSSLAIANKQFGHFPRVPARAQKVSLGTGFSRPVDNLCKERGVAKRQDINLHKLETVRAYSLRRRLAAAESRSFGT